jgi:parallel beta-helix repeat protein
MLLFLFPAHFAGVQAAILNVPGDYLTIQEAVTAAGSGDIIEVAAGVYTESVYVETSLTIRGQDKYNTVVDSNGTGHVFWLTQNDVVITGFTMLNGNYCAIKAEMTGGHFISDNIISNSLYGVYLYSAPSSSQVVENTFINNDMYGIKVSSSNNNNISHNQITDSTYGIKLDGTSEDNTITGNTISGASHGIYASYSPNNDIDLNEVSAEITGTYSLYSDNINIRNNTFSECAYGIQIYGSGSNLVFGNTMAQGGYGIYLVLTTSTTVDANLASNNGWGIATYDSDSNNIIQNTVSYNTYGIDLTSYSTGNTIALNNIVKNGMQRHQDSTSGANTWNKLISGDRYGNHWSNYPGQDTNGDGVGDTLIPHEGVDYYPLIEPWIIVHDVAILSVEPSTDMVYRGQIVNVTVVVRNEGTTNETFIVTTKYSKRTIETKTVTNLARYTTATLVFTWNTTNTPARLTYEIRAEAIPFTLETDKIDNTLVDGEVYIKLMGDVNDDGIVDILDVGLVSAHWYPGPPVGPLGYDPEADLNSDGAVDIFDIGIISNHMGETE